MPLAEKTKDVTNKPMTTGPAGIALIKEFEGLKDGNTRKPLIQPYTAPEGKRTTGWGHVLLASDAWMEDGITEAQAEDILKSDLRKFEKVVNSAVKVPINQNEFDALVAFVLNVGATNFRGSTLLKHLNARSNPDDMDAEREIAQHFLDWNKYTPPGTKKKVVSAGLTRRRQAESRLYMTEPPKPLAKSNQIKAGAGVGIAGVASLCAQAPETLKYVQGVVQPVNEQLKNNGIELPAIGMILTVCIIGGAVFMVVNRYLKNRQEKRDRGVII